MVASKTQLRRAAIDALGRVGLRDAFRMARSTVRFVRAGKLGQEYAIRRTRVPTPLPPAWLIYLVQERISWFAFHHEGRESVDYLSPLLIATNPAKGTVPRVLDFGCGCARLLRWWGDDVAAYGCDYDPRLVSWCAAHLENTPVLLNAALPPLGFETGFFDALYAQSVLTHLTPDNQERWIQEWTRVVRPGGRILVTTHGPGHLHEPHQLAELARAGTLTVTPEGVGNLCAVWNTPDDVTNRLGRHLEVLAYRPREMPASNQDVWVFRVPPNPPA